MQTRTKHGTRAFAVTAGAVALLIGVALAQKSIQVFVNGKATSKPAIVQGNETYIPLSTLRAAGVPVQVSGSRVELTLTAANTTDAVAGSGQLTGGLGAIGKTVTLGKKVGLNFTLRSAEFSVKRVDIGQNQYAPEDSQKLLILRFTVQNPQKRDVDFNSGSFRFTAVDSRDVNVTPNYGSLYLARDGDVVPLKVELKPAQKIDAYAVLVVAAAGPIPKLIVQREGDLDAPVVRYDLTKLVKPIPAPFADASDPSGATALAKVTVAPGVLQPSRYLQFRVDGVTYSSDATFQGRNVSAGKRWAIVAMTAKNDVAATGRGVDLGDCTFASEFTASDDDVTTGQRCGQQLLKAARDERQRSEVAPGAELKFRMFFEVPMDITTKSLSITEEKGRTLVFDLSSFK